MKKLYSGCGDLGNTRVFHCNLDKDSPLIGVIGAIDELQSALDMARINCNFESVISIIQTKLRFLAGELAGYVNDDKKISLFDVSQMEDIMDDLSDVVPSHFVRFNKPGAIYLNEARVRTRALERKIVAVDGIRDEVRKYANRLSDLLFVLSYKCELGITDGTE